tara:strand:- start:850 stop:1704 length:855 start_codon:yes stop_codon:yes gene_type:complete
MAYKKPGMTMNILTCLWQRPKLSKIFLSYYKAMQERLEGDIELNLIAVGSEGPITRKMAKDCGWDYIQMPNSPLSTKWNAGIKTLKRYNASATVILGSDDFISDSLLHAYKGLIKDDYVLVGVKDMYMYDVKTNRLGRWKGYMPGVDSKRVGETIGMARCIGKKVMEMIDYDIWGGIEAESGLDGIMSEKFKTLRLNYCSTMTCPIHRINDDTKMYKWGHVGLYLGQIPAVGVDIKTTTNITKLDTYIEFNPDCMEWVEDVEGFFSNTLPFLDLKKVMDSDEEV